MSSNLNLTTYVKIAQKMSEDRKYNSIQPYVYAKLYQGITNINPTKMQHITCTCSFMFIVGHKPPPLLEVELKNMRTCYFYLSKYIVLGIVS